ncbi:MAG: hypothetical protein QM802_23930 [Agriterribacter sp.]
MQRNDTANNQSAKNRPMRKHIIPSLLAICIIAGCKKKDIIEGVPSCINTKVENIKDDPNQYYIGKVSEYLFQGNIVYTFEPDDRIMDAGTVIINTSCDTVCNVGGYGGPDVVLCNGVKFYDNAVLKRTIWEK